MADSEAASDDRDVLRRLSIGEHKVSVFFNALTSTVRQAWLAENFCEARFSDIAHVALIAANPADSINYKDIVDWLVSVETFPTQLTLDEAFGQPPLTMFCDGLFQIEVLFWHTATTAIHRHAFSGAFAVLGGSSLHSRYEFIPRTKINARFLVGRAKLCDVEFLETGAVRKIGRGDDLIHSLFHLDSPTVTVVLRTCIDPESGPEYVYYPPSIAVDPSRHNPRVTKQLAILDMLSAARSPHYEQVASAILTRSDVHTAWLTLSRMSLHHRSEEIYDRLLSVARDRHGEVMDEIASAIEEDRRRALIIYRRKTVHDPTHRFFLALLLNLPDRESILKVIAARFPGLEALTLIEKWIVEMSATGSLGIEKDDVIGSILHWCLQGCSPEEVALHLADSYAPSEVVAQEDLIHDACHAIHHNPFLAPLFVTDGAQDQSTAGAG